MCILWFQVPRRSVRRRDGPQGALCRAMQKKQDYVIFRRRVWKLGRSPCFRRRGTGKPESPRPWIGMGYGQVHSQT